MAAGRRPPGGALAPLADCHTHLLPGVDDGAASAEEALELLGRAAAGGTRRLFLTPHYLPGHFAAGPRLIREKTAELAGLLAARGLDLELFPGQEVYLSPELPAAWRQGRLLPLGGTGRHLLVELPLDVLPPWAADTLFALQVEGLTPVLAHPERCPGVGQDPAWLAGVVARGVLVQLNAPSLTGAYGPLVARTARRLLRAGLVHLLGSDAHSPHRPPDLGPALAEVRHLVGEEDLRHLAWDNPAALLAGREIPLGPALGREPPPRRLFPWSRRS